MEQEKIEDKTHQRAVNAFTLTIVIYLIFIYCLIASGGSLNEGDGTGSVWWLLIGLAPPLWISSNILVGLSISKKEKLAIAALVLNLIPLVAILITVLLATHLQ